MALRYSRTVQTLVKLPARKMQENTIDNTEDKKHKSIFKILLRIWGTKKRQQK